METSFAALAWFIIHNLSLLLIVKKSASFAKLPAQMQAGMIFLSLYLLRRMPETNEDSVKQSLIEWMKWRNEGMKDIQGDIPPQFLFFFRLNLLISFCFSPGGMAARFSTILVSIFRMSSNLSPPIRCGAKDVNRALWVELIGANSLNWLCPFAW